LAILLVTRHAAGLSQVELSKKLGKPQPWVSNVETGVRRVDVIEFYAVARALGSDPQALFAKLVATLPKVVRI
jgi:transcriptional regulator with XRE-family HTH domain